MKAKKTILDTIGSTPMVRINALSPNPKVKIFAKLEGFNPTGSIKDRIAVKMIETAEREGRLTKGKTIIEPTSGNTGIGLAIVGIVKGYPVEIVMSEAVSIERRKIIRAYGGTVRLTPAAEGTDGAIRLARKLVAENPDKYFTSGSVMFFRVRNCAAAPCCCSIASKRWLVSACSQPKSPASCTACCNSRAAGREKPR